MSSSVVVTKGELVAAASSNGKLAAARTGGDGSGLDEADEREGHDGQHRQQPVDGELHPRQRALRRRHAGARGCAERAERVEEVDVPQGLRVDENLRQVLLREMKIRKEGIRVREMSTTVLQ